ncbi:MAG: protein-L-isoaspartate O-methyltransferase [Acetobacter sp.]|nr:protein-L-isoaspartate O-methyltransferase [Acetobacter sp.]
MTLQVQKHQTLETTAVALKEEETNAHIWDQARHLMVDDQLRPSEITHPDILRAMRLLPREFCVSAHQQVAAYADLSLPLTRGRVFLQPLFTARLLQEATPHEGERALVVGASTGYAAGVLASLGLSVTALESDEVLAKQGKEFCQKLGFSVTWHEGSLAEGVAENAPYDLIYCDGAIATLPGFFTRDLANQGRVVGFLQKPNRLPELFRAQRASEQEKGLAFIFFTEARIPILPGLEPSSAFVF